MRVYQKTDGELSFLGEYVGPDHWVPTRIRERRYIIVRRPTSLSPRLGTVPQKIKRTDDSAFVECSAVSEDGKNFEKVLFLLEGPNDIWEQPDWQPAVPLPSAPS